MKIPLIGMILLQQNKITQKQLDEAINIQQENGGLIGIILVQLNYISTNDLTEALLDQTYVKEKQNEIK